MENKLKLCYITFEVSQGGIYMSDAAFNNMIAEVDNFSFEQCVLLLSRLSQVFAKKKNEKVTSKKSMYGVWKNEPFYMAPDFDDPLDDFEEYM